MKRIGKWVLVLFMLAGSLNVPVKGFAQTNLGPTPQDPGDPCDYDDPLNPCPIDGGLGVLLALGVGYGIKKYRTALVHPGKNQDAE